MTTFEIPTTWNRADELLATARNPAAGKPIGNNTRLIRLEDGSIGLKYHSTVIVTYRPDGSISLDTGGWRTATTKDRMNRAMPAGYSLRSQKGSWFIVEHATGTEVPYFDGIGVWPGGVLAIPEQEDTAALDNIARQWLRASINDFVRGITPEQLIDAFENNGGDCWSCAFDMDEDCLAGHVEEGYFHAALMLRAVRAAGYPEPELIMQMIYGSAQRGKIDAVMARTLRSYLVKRLITQVPAA